MFSICHSLLSKISLQTQTEQGLRNCGNVKSMFVHKRVHDENLRGEKIKLEIKIPQYVCPETIFRFFGLAKGFKCPLMHISQL